MNRGLWEKLTSGFVFVVLIWIAGWFAMLNVSFSSGARFYVPLTVWVCVGLSVSVIVGLGGWLKRKVYWRGIGVLALLFVIVIAGYEINKAYHNRFEKMREFEAPLTHYEPFAEGNKLAELKEPATLNLTEDLPKLDGATALYPLYSSFVQTVYPEKTYDLHKSEVIVSRTSEAFINLIKGKVDLIFMAEPSELQLASAKMEGVELKKTPIGADAFVFFTHAKNPVDGLTTEQIRDIYSGKTTNWSQLGGRDATIRAFQRPQDSGSQSALQRLMRGEQLMTPPEEDYVGGMGGIITQTADYRNYPDAIGFTFLYYASEMVNNKQIKLLAIDGVAPNRANIANRSYPFSNLFYAVTAGTDNPNVEPFIEWMLSEQGQELVQKTGYTPISIPSTEK